MNKDKNIYSLFELDASFRWHDRLSYAIQSLKVILQPALRRRLWRGEQDQEITFNSGKLSAYYCEQKNIPRTLA